MLKMFVLALVLTQSPFEPRQIPGPEPKPPRTESEAEKDRRYWKVTIPGMHTTRYTHVQVEGKLLYTYIADDGDLHFRLEDEKGNRLTCEAIPTLPVPRPRPNRRIRVYGISRKDPWHGNKPEIHPVEKWEYIDEPK